MSILLTGLVLVIAYLLFIYFVLERYGLKIYRFIEVNTFHFRYKISQRVTRRKRRGEDK